MGLGAVFDDLNQVDIMEHRPVKQQWVGHLDVVVRQGQHQLARRIVAVQQALRHVLAHRQFDVVNQLAENLAHQRALSVGKVYVVLDEQFLHRIEQRIATGLRLLTGKRHQ
ncbi:MAG: hypothetical protein VYA71_06190 [Pseudomonadota bacterium]|nr:hypothetical protein [Pseudomonadota bacterium]